MNSMRIASQRIIYAVAIFVMAIALVLPAIASAAQVTERSIGLSSSTAGAENVTYSVNFTPAAGAGAFVVDFCANTPLIGQECTAPTGFDASGATIDGTPTGVTSASVSAETSLLTVTGGLTASEAVTVNLAGIDNPSATGTFFARIVTYDTAGNAENYASENLGTGAVDQGGVALVAHDTIGVSGVVLETLTFCVSGQQNEEDEIPVSPIEANCGGTMTPPVLQLGEQVGTSDVYALAAGEVSEGSIFTQISTNAVGGAVVHLKSDALGCGGLMRSGAPEACDIAPAMDQGVDGSVARFGVRTYEAIPTATGATPTGTFQPAVGSLYGTTDYALNWVENDDTGVTSTFGDAFLDTADGPVNNQNMRLEFAASATNNTPAGTYSAGLSLIAVGKF